MTSGEILASLTDIANTYQPVAIFWHVFGLVLLASLLLGPFQPRERLAPLLVLPLGSVAIFSWAGSNVFNGTLFTLAAAVLVLVGVYLSPGECRKASPPVQVAGALLMLFGLVYPHFVAVEAAWQYLLFAPVGLLPCPTLSLVIGASIIVNGFESRAWSFTLACFGLSYGLLGALWLGVHLDWALVAGAGILFIQAATLRSETAAGQPQ